MQSISIGLNSTDIARLSDVAEQTGLKRGTVMRLVIERWLADPQPLVSIPLRPQPHPTAEETT